MAGIKNTVRESKFKTLLANRMPRTHLDLVAFLDEHQQFFGAHRFDLALLAVRLDVLDDARPRAAERLVLAHGGAVLALARLGWKDAERGRDRKKRNMEIFEKLKSSQWNPQVHKTEHSPQFHQQR